MLHNSVQVLAPELYIAVAAVTAIINISLVLVSRQGASFHDHYREPVDG